MRHVLLVDDDGEIRELLTEMLEASGFAVEVAANGATALASIEARRPSVVILDLMMPVMDGWQLRVRMLDDPTLADIPVIVMSSAGDLVESTSALRASHVLAKPVPWPTLLAALRQATAPKGAG